MRVLVYSGSWKHCDGVSIRYHAHAAELGRAGHHLSLATAAAEMAEDDDSIPPRAAELLVRSCRCLISHLHGVGGGASINRSLATRNNDSLLCLPCFPVVSRLDGIA